MKHHLLFFFILLFAFQYHAASTHAGAGGASDKPLIFSTWEGFEVDKCASIWLIKKCIDKDVQIKFFPQGRAITEGIPFDVPEAELRRYHNMSTFEAFLKHYKLQDPKLIHIGKIIHDIEINIWEQKVFPETRHIEEAIIKIIKDSKNNDEVIEKSCRYFDSLYQEIGLNLGHKGR